MPLPGEQESRDASTMARAPNSPLCSKLRNKKLEQCLSQIQKIVVLRPR